MVRESIRPARDKNGRLEGVVAESGRSYEADRYVFTAGPWLPGLFPEVLKDRIVPTRQEVFYFGCPGNDTRFEETDMPAWIDEAGGGFYGIPGNEYRGMKISCNSLGPEVDPTFLDRSPTREALDRARDRLAHRFPDLNSAPLLESGVCQYENTPVRNLILDFHPESDRFFLAGGGSGHGFKMGPALGDWNARVVLNEEPLKREFQISRFDES